MIVEDFMYNSARYIVKCASIFIKVKNIDGTPYVICVLHLLYPLPILWIMQGQASGMDWTLHTDL